MKKILQKDAPDSSVLREKAKEIALGHIKTPKTKKILKEMASALAHEHDGVAIAAPQIGYPLRIFIVSGKVFSIDKRLASKEEMGKEDGKVAKNLIFINPKISKLSREKEWLPEGCLSVRPLYGKTFRSKKATVTAYDEEGKKITRGASGLLAQIFQHETDHLDGILFTDHAKDIKEERRE